MVSASTLTSKSRIAAGFLAVKHARAFADGSARNRPGQGRENQPDFSLDLFPRGQGPTVRLLCPKGMEPRSLTYQGHNLARGAWLFFFKWKFSNTCRSRLTGNEFPCSYCSVSTAINFLPLLFHLAHFPIHIFHPLPLSVGPFWGLWYSSITVSHHFLPQYTLLSFICHSSRVLEEKISCYYNKNFWLIRRNLTIQPLEF